MTPYEGVRRFFLSVKFATSMLASLAEWSNIVTKIVLLNLTTQFWPVCFMFRLQPGLWWTRMDILKCRKKFKTTKKYAKINLKLWTAYLQFYSLSIFILNSIRKKLRKLLTKLVWLLISSNISFRHIWIFNKKLFNATTKSTN